MRDLLIVLVIGLGTYVMRAAFLVTAGAGPPPRVARALRHVGPAVLAAITVPALLAPRGEMSMRESVPAVLAAIAASLLWLRTRSLPVALFSALALWWVVLLGLAALQ